MKLSSGNLPDEGNRVKVQCPSRPTGLNRFERSSEPSSIRLRMEAHPYGSVWTWQMGSVNRWPPQTGPRRRSKPSLAVGWRQWRSSRSPSHWVRRRAASTGTSPIGTLCSKQRWSSGSDATPTRCWPASTRPKDVGSRLRNLLRLAFMSVRGDTAGGAGAIELALQANASHTLVAPTLERVTSRRLAALSRLYSALGLSRARARDRALLAYTSFLGHAQMARSTPDLLPAGRAFGRHVDQVIEALVRVDD